MGTLPRRRAAARAAGLALLLVLATRCKEPEPVRPEPSGAALAVVNAAARSSAPALGYTGAYAFANVILTFAGTLIVRF